MKAFAIGIGGFVVAAVLAAAIYAGYVQYQKERLKEAILGDLACRSASTIEKFGIQCGPVANVPVTVPANVSPPAPSKK